MNWKGGETHGCRPVASVHEGDIVCNAAMWLQSRGSWQCQGELVLHLQGSKCESRGALSILSYLILRWSRAAKKSLKWNAVQYIEQKSPTNLGKMYGCKAQLCSHKPCWLSKQHSKGRDLPMPLLPYTPSYTLRRHNQTLHQLSSYISLLFCFLSNIQAECTELVIRNWRYWYCQVGSGTVSSPRLGDMFLLHLERSQIHWESKCSFTLFIIIAVSRC